MKVQNALIPVAFLASIPFLAAQEKRPVTFKDILEMKSVSAPQISPDGSAVLYAVTAWEEGADGKMESVSHVFRVSVPGGDERQLTYGEKGEREPQWSPDGKWVSFLTMRNGGDEDDEPKAQIWLMRAAGGEASALTETKEGVQSYAWSPDSTKIAFTTKDALSEDDEQREKRRDDRLIYEEDRRMHHLWVVNVDTKETARQTEGEALTVKGRPSWSPDGTRIAFTGAPTLWLRDGRDDVYILTIGAGVEKITDNPGPDVAPDWSPDGASIAFLSTPNDNEPLPDETLVRPLTNARLMVYDVASRTIRDLSPDFDRIPTNPRWAADGRRILFIAGDSVYREMFAFDVEAERYDKLTVGRFVGFGSMSRDGSRAAFTLESSAEPVDVYVAGTDFSNPRKLTAIHSHADALALGATEVIRWKSTDGFEVEGLLLKPVGYEEGMRYPLMTVAHGGPTGAPPRLLPGSLRRWRSALGRERLGGSLSEPSRKHELRREVHARKPCGLGRR